MAVLIRPYSSFALDAVISLDAITYSGGNVWIDRSSTQGDNAVLTDVTTSTTAENFQVLDFNGSTSVGTIANRNWDFNSEQTIMMALRRTVSARRNPYNQAYGGAGTWTHETSGTITYFWGNSGVDGGSYQAASSAVININEWAIMTSVRNPTSVVWYKNGVPTSSRSNPYGSSVVSGTRDILIGDGYAGPHWTGNIGFVFVWDRALNPTEVLTYYDRTKFRFGLS